MWAVALMPRRGGQTTGLTLGGPLALSILGTVHERALTFPVRQVVLDLRQKKKSVFFRKKSCKMGNWKFGMWAAWNLEI